MIPLYREGEHANLLYDDLTSGAMVQANQHLVIDHGEALLLDPGGHKVYPKLFGELAGTLRPGGLRHVFFSHQDPDIIASANGWLMVTDAQAWLSALWLRFIPHFGVDELVTGRIHPIPDEGMELPLGRTVLRFLPAHFLHSPGNFQVYDPVSKVLYTGDLGASLGAEYAWVDDLDAHVRFMEGFHRRYLPSNRALQLWIRQVRDLDIEVIAPQHGAMMRGKEQVARFVAWLEGLACGLDLWDAGYPGRP